MIEPLTVELPLTDKLFTKGEDNPIDPESDKLPGMVILVACVTEFRAPENVTVVPSNCNAGKLVNCKEVIRLL